MVRFNPREYQDVIRYRLDTDSDPAYRKGEIGKTVLTDLSSRGVILTKA